MPATPILALPYFTGDDPPAGMDQQKALALKLDGYSGIAPPLVTALPGSPVDGQEIYYLADPASGVIWHLRYNAASSSPYKWERIGGPGLYAAVATSFNITSTGFVDQGGPQIVAPLSGDYRIAGGSWIGVVATAAGQQAMMAPRVGATAPDPVSDRLASAYSPATTGGSTFGNVGAGAMQRTLTAGTTVACQYRTTGGTGQFAARWLELTPVRVG